MDVFLIRVKRRLGLAEARAKHDAEGASPAPTSKHPKHRVAQPSGLASTREEESQIMLVDIKYID